MVHSFDSVSVLCFTIGLGRSGTFVVSQLLGFAKHTHICRFVIWYHKRPMLDARWKWKGTYSVSRPLSWLPERLLNSEHLGGQQEVKAGGDWTTSTLFRSHPRSLLIPAYATHPTFNMGGGEEREIDDTGQWVSRAGEPVEHRKQWLRYSPPPPPPLLLPACSTTDKRRSPPTSVVDFAFLVSRFYSLLNKKAPLYYYYYYYY